MTEMIAKKLCDSYVANAALWNYSIQIERFQVKAGKLTV